MIDPDGSLPRPGRIGGEPGVDDEGAWPGAEFQHGGGFWGQGVYRGQQRHVADEWIRPDGHLADVLSHLAAEWVAGREGRHFFLCLSYKNCHTPLNPADRHQGTLDDVAVQLPDSGGWPLRPVSASGFGRARGQPGL